MSENNYRGSSEEKEESPRQSASRSRSKSPSHSRSSAHSSKSKSRSRSHSYSRSRSHSPVRRPRSSSRRNKSHSRSRSPNPYYKDRRSRSPSPYNRGRRGRNSSHSPLSNRKRHQGNRESQSQPRANRMSLVSSERDNPSPSRCLGVFGLSLYTTERDLRPVFEKYGPVEAIQIVYDHQTGRSRGFGFVYYEDTKDAEVAKERTTGIELDGRRIRVDYSVTKRAHTPTPGVYMGKASQHRDSGRRGGGRRYDDYDDRRDYDYRGGRDRDYYRDDYYRGSSSYYRSRSRSYSPRRY